MKNRSFCFWFIFTLIFCTRLWGQSPAPLAATYTTTESRCRATGSITIHATGGSGNYHYKAVGPVTTPFTASKTIAGLEAGTYSIVVKDVVLNKELQVGGAIVAGSYADLRFDLQATSVGCAGNDGTITATNRQGGRAPFTYAIVAPSERGVGTANSTGRFTGLPPGEYTIQLTDSCGGMQVRTARVEASDWQLLSATLTRLSCTEGEAFVALQDAGGNTNEGPAFNGFRYGVVQAAGDTLWSSQRSFRFALGKRSHAALLVKDRCGEVFSYFTALPDSVLPSVAEALEISNRACSTFSAKVAHPQNLTSPEYCVYNSSNVQVACNSTGVFDKLPYGRYLLKVRDACYDTTIVRNFSASAAVPSVASVVSVTNAACSTFTASITGQVNLTNPQYCLYNSSNVQLSCNNTGVFSSLPYGSYTIQVTDGCSGITLTRTLAATRPVPVISSISTANLQCTTFDLKANNTAHLQKDPQFCLYDSSGRLVSCNGTGGFTTLPYGSYCLKVFTTCGDVSAPYCFTVKKPAPGASNTVAISKMACATFTASIAGQTQLYNPQYCLYNSSNVQLGCNSTGVFDSLAYGSYTIKIKDGCTGTVLTRSFSAARPVPVLEHAATVSNTTCATFTATLKGSNLFSPVYTVQDEAGKVVATGSGNVFNKLPYGKYCFSVKDACSGNTLRFCQTITAPQSITVSTTKTCTLNTTDMRVQFASSNGPFSVEVYHPDGSLVREAASDSAVLSLSGLPALPDGAAYRVVGTNSCGQGDEKIVVPNATTLTRSVQVLPQCPTARLPQGTGNIVVTCASNFAVATPAIVSRDGARFNRSYTSNAGNSFTFAGLAPGKYVVQYSIAGCGVKAADTVVVAPYTYPAANRSAIYQCNDGSFSLSASASGGVAPYRYEIIGSLPDTPSLVTPRQSSPVFPINNGSAYSVVRLRATDACGNGTLSDVSVLPLQNVFVTASQNCLYKAAVLTADSIPNAAYEWYLKQSSTDSVPVGTGSVLAIPFLTPEKTGEYVCRVSVNNNCLTRFASIVLSGNCEDRSLPVQVQLYAHRTAEGTVQLQWEAANEQEVAWYRIERKLLNTASFTLVDSVAARSSAQRETYTFTDNGAGAGKVQYRLRIVSKEGKTKFSNIVLATAPGTVLRVQPNPAQGFLRIVWKEIMLDFYQLELYNAAGQRVHSMGIGPQAAKEYTYQRPGFVLPGLYLLHCINRSSGERQTFKVVFQ